jgi:hypothetical protein
MVLEETAYYDCMSFYRNHGYTQSASGGYVK